jgi:hypothetical protein
MIKKWKKFQDYIAERLKEIDPFARSSKGSGNQGELGDVNNRVGLNIECKQTDKVRDVSIKKEDWEHVCNEIPLHSDRIPVLCLENNEGKRWAVLDLDTFLELYQDWYFLKFNGKSKEII